VLPDNYTNPSLSQPAIGGYYDGMFGCRALRVGYGVNLTSLIGPFSQNDTYMVAFPCTSPACNPRGTSETIYQLNGDSMPTKLCDVGALGVGSDFYWDTVNEWQYWWHDSTHIYWGDARTCTLAAAKNLYYTVSRTGYTNIGFAGGQGDLSWDGNHILIIGGLPVTKAAILTLRPSPSLGPDFTGGSMGVDTSAKGGKVYSDNTGGIEYASGSGLEVFDGGTGAFINTINKNYGADHQTVGKDPASGNSVIVLGTGNDLNPPCSFWASLKKQETIGGAETCLVTGGGSNELLGGHFSLNNILTTSDTPLVSIENDTKAPLPNPNFPADWLVYTNEIVLAHLDGSTPVRLIHHQSRNLSCSGTVEYFNGPRAAISRDGRYVVYTSNFGDTDSLSGSCGDGPWSIYLMKLW
jgi:hypothetical protein